MSEQRTFADVFAPAAWATSLLALVMLLITLATGVSQEHFEVLWPRDDYARAMLRGAGPLKAILAVDFCFITAFVIFFIAWSERQIAQGAGRVAVSIGLSAMLFVAVLDFLEDAHLLMLLRSVTYAVPLADADLRWQMVLSTLKFAVSSAGIAILGLTWPATGGVALGLKTLLIGQVALGAAIFFFDPPLQTILGLVRAIVFVTGPLLLLYADRSVTRRPA